MATSEAGALRSQIDLVQFAGYPIYFFDAQKLVAALPNDNYSVHFKERLAARIDALIGRADIRVTVPNGFYVIFASRVESVVKQRISDICEDVLKHFFGAGASIPDMAQSFCRPATIKVLARDMGEVVLCDPLASEPVRPSSGRPPAMRGGETSDLIEPSSLIKDMNAVFLRHFGTARAETPRFQFAPIWDSLAEGIASFGCQPMFHYGARLNTAIERSNADNVAQQCAVDVMGLATALKGVWHVLQQGQLALVAVPIHIETLAWSKQRKAYLTELAQVEPRMRALLAFRINGFDIGSGLSQLAQGVSALRPYTKRIFAHLPNAHVDFSHAGQFGVTGFGISAPHQGENPNETLAAATIRLKRLCTRQNAMAYVDQVQSAANVRVLKDLGVRLIAGPIFGTASDEPGPVCALGLASLRERADHAPRYQSVFPAKTNAIAY